MSNSFASQLDQLLAQAASEQGEAPAPAEASEEDQPSEELQSSQEDDPGPADAPDEPAVAGETPAQKLRRLELSKALVGAVSTEKMVHGSLILNGVAEKCVSCGMPLTDAVSIQRCLGPDCSAKGYAEDPVNPDEMGAMIELAEFPVLVDFLSEHYKPLGLRGLMNGLVRIACLNRKSPAHAACCNAVEMLGYDKLANTLRNSLVIGQIKDSERHPLHHHVWIKRANWTREFGYACGRVPHAFFDRLEKGWIVPKRPEARLALWHALMEHYAHEAIKTPKGVVKIPTLEEQARKHKA